MRTDTDRAGDSQLPIGAESDMPLPVVKRTALAPKAMLLALAVLLQSA